LAARKGPGQLLRAFGLLARGLELDVDVGFAALLQRAGLGVTGLPSASVLGHRHAVVEHHHVVLDHAQPARFRIAARSLGRLDPLQVLALVDVGIGAVQAGLLVVPQREADAAPGRHAGRVQDARQFHHQRGAGGVVVGRLAIAHAVHVGGDDVHLLGMGAADLGAIDLFARAAFRIGLLGVEARRRSSGWASGFSLTPVGARVPNRVLPPWPDGPPRPPPVPRRAGLPGGRGAGGVNVVADALGRTQP
jgi:hypothetical protein